MERSLFWAVLGFSYLSLLALIGAALALGERDALVLGLLAIGAAYVSQGCTFAAWVSKSLGEDYTWRAFAAVVLQAVSAILWLSGVFLLWRG